MKTEDTMQTISLGEFIARAFAVYGEHHAPGMIWLALETKMVELRGESWALRS